MEHNILRSGSWWGKAVASGLVGGAAMGLYIMTAMAFIGTGFSAFPNRVAATFEAFRPPFEGFQASATLTGLLLHFATAAFWGAVFALVIGSVPRILYRRGRAIVTGLVYGILVWLIMGLVAGPAVNPSIAAIPGGNWFLAHLVFGLGTGWTLYAWARNWELPWALKQEPRAADDGIQVKPS